MAGAGGRDRLVVFQRYGTTENTFGEPEANDMPADLARAMAQVFYGRGSERRAAAAEGASVTATFRVLSTAAVRAVTEGDVIAFGGEWDIEGIAPIGRRFIEFTATRRSA